MEYVRSFVQSFGDAVCTVICSGGLCTASYNHQ